MGLSHTQTAQGEGMRQPSVCVHSVTSLLSLRMSSHSAIEGAGISTDPHSWTWRARLSSWLEAKAFDCRLQ